MHFNRQQAAPAGLYVSTIARWRVKDAHTIEIETKAHDAVFPYNRANVSYSAPPRIRAAGHSVLANADPHIRGHQLSVLPDSPVRDQRVGQAARVGRRGGLALPAKGRVNEGHPWFGRPTVDLSYEPVRARRPLAEAGFGPRNPVKTPLIVAPSGSARMQPLPMNGLLQQKYREAGIALEFEVMDWDALRGRRRLSNVSEA